MRSVRAAFLLSCTVLLGGSAWAQSSPWYVGGLLSVTHESNLLRLADEQSPVAGESRSDVVLGTALIGGINQPIGRQRVVGSLTLRDNRYERNSRYNNQSYNGSLGLDWSSAQRISGTVAVSTARSLSLFNPDGIGQLGAKNLETTQAANASLSVGLVTEYSLELGGGTRRARNSLDDARVQARDSDQSHAWVGLSWRPGGALSLSLVQRQTNAEYPRLITSAAGLSADRYRQAQSEAAAIWQASGASQLELRLNRASTRYVVNEVRNFSSTNGALGWAWQSTAKLRLATRLSRDNALDTYPTSSAGFIQGIPVVGTLPINFSDARAINTLRLQADWEASAKLAAVSSLQHTRRHLRRDTFVPAPFDAVAPLDSTDATTIFILGGRWTPLRNALLGCDLTHEKRRANGALSTNLNAAGLNCYGQMTLQ